jgi:L-fucose mutarotase
MLKGIDPLLNADLLYALAAMGHGDELAVVDCNFPSTSTARRLIRLDGADVPSVVRAVLTLLPLDTFVDEPLVRMEIVGAPGDMPDVQREVHALVTAAEEREIRMGSLDREAFYRRTRDAFAVVATSEPRPYGCFLLVKGVTYPPKELDG